MQYYIMIFMKYYIIIFMEYPANAAAVADPTKK